MVDPGKRDLRLLGAEGRHREQLHPEEQAKSWNRKKQRRVPGSVADPDSNPSNSYVFGPPCLDLDPDLFTRGMDPDPSIIKQK